jgi:hypothetical protein
VSQRYAQILGNWITGPITTVRDEHILAKLTAVAGVGSTAWKWFTECMRSGNVVLGNRPCSVGKTKALPGLIF